MLLTYAACADVDDLAKIVFGASTVHREPAFLGIGFALAGTIPVYTILVLIGPLWLLPYGTCSIAPRRARWWGSIVGQGDG
jgi:hypothetical protein